MRHLRDYWATAPGAEPDRDDLVGLLRAGLPNSVVMSDPAAVIGANPVAAAVRELGLASDAFRSSRCETAGVRS